MKGLYSMQREAIYKTPWLGPRTGIIHHVSIGKAIVGRPKSMTGEEFVHTNHRWCGCDYICKYIDFPCYTCTQMLKGQLSV